MLMRSPLTRARRRPPGFIPPAKPVLSAIVPTGPNWIYELKHDGYRLLCRKERDRVQLSSRNGRDWTAELVAIAAALRGLPGDFVIDGEAVAIARPGCPTFTVLMARDGQAGACLYAFDLLHLGREDLRPLELANRRGVLKKLLRKGAPVLIFSEHMDGADGEAMFRHACATGLDGIISKRNDSHYKSSRCLSWVKVKYPDDRR